MKKIVLALLFFIGSVHAAKITYEDEKKICEIKRMNGWKRSWELASMTHKAALFGDLNLCQRLDAEFWVEFDAVIKSGCFKAIAQGIRDEKNEDLSEYETVLTYLLNRYQGSYASLYETRSYFSKIQKEITSKADVIRGNLCRDESEYPLEGKEIKGIFPIFFHQYSLT